MNDQPWCDIKPEEAEKARQAGMDFGSRRSGIQKAVFIAEVMDAQSSILRMRIDSGDSIGNAQEISRLFASAAMHRWDKTNGEPLKGEVSNVMTFPNRNTRRQTP